MNIEQKNGSTVFKKTSEYKPGKNWRNFLIGRPLQTADAPQQTIGRLLGLAVFSSDALSSVAYGPQEIFLVLAAAGVSAFSYTIPIALAIVLLLVILTISYEQTIHAYPGGGGAYIVARDNLGELPAQTAGAALLTDYVLTVAVSVSSGVAQLTSAYPVLFPDRVIIAVSFVVLIMIINLRGVKESGMAFAVPTYFFIVMMYVTIVIGLVRFAFGTLGAVQMPPQDVIQLQTTLAPITLFLILKAFASGTTALTGVEAISNGITAFKEPRSKNAGQTLIMMAFILGSMLFAITFLANKIGATPSETETVISQLARTVFANRSIFYLATIASTTVSGIATLAVVASTLIIMFQASVTKLIPLYAIGVFLSFTLSQAGMARRWWKCGHLKPGEEIVEPGSTLRFEPGWQLKMVINGFGSLCTAVVMIVFAVTKFKDGAWVVVLLTPTLVTIFFAIHHHYKNLAKQLSLEKYTPSPRVAHQKVIMPISGVHKGTLAALRYAKTLSDDITVVHISSNEVETKKLQEKWEIWGDGYRLVVLDSPYRLFIEPLMAYIDEIDAQKQPNEVISIVVPQFIPKRWFTNFLHARTADTLRRLLLYRKDIVILEVPYQVN
ncbi:MAG: APC family permease [Anaerolineaceae bacterium]